MTAPTAWYLRCSADDVGDSAILVGDRGRVLLAAELLDDAVILNEDRGLTTATGSYDGHRITVSAFGMGAPIAAVVMHELAMLGVKRFVRLGTAMSTSLTELGQFVLAQAAIRGESTSATYLPLSVPAVPDFTLTQALAAATRDLGIDLTTGLFASYDGFYTEMFDTGLGHQRVAERYAELASWGVVGVDMETSALLVTARALDVAAASLCLASVAGVTNEKMPQAERVAAEGQLLRAGFAALSSTVATVAP